MGGEEMSFYSMNIKDGLEESSQYVFEKDEGAIFTKSLFNHADIPSATVKEQKSVIVYTPQAATNIMKLLLKKRRRRFLRDFYSIMTTF